TESPTACPGGGPPRAPAPAPGTPGGGSRRPAGGGGGPPTPPVITPGVPAVPAVYGPPGPPTNGYVGIYRPEYRLAPLPTLLCPSDPSPGRDPQATARLVYAKAAHPWTPANHLAHWHHPPNVDAHP